MEAIHSHPNYSIEPAEVLRESRMSRDPSQSIPGMPPNMGDSLLPHVVTFQGIISSVSRVYRPSDEALKNSQENARFMLNDTTVTECLEQRRRSGALLNWHLEPEDRQNSVQRELAEEMTAILKMTPYFTQYRENLLYALWYGKYGIQHQFRWKKVRGKQRICINEWLPINGDKIVFRFDDGTHQYDPHQIGIRVGAGYMQGETVQGRWKAQAVNRVEPTDYGLAVFLAPWERKLIALHKHMIEDGEYEDPQSGGRIHGVGIRSRIYWAWFQKQETLAWLMEYLERSAFGLEIWYYPYGNAEAEKKTRAAAEDRIGQGRNVILMPRPVDESGVSPYGVEKLEPGMAGAEVVKSIVQEYFSHQIKRYILGQTLTTEATNTGLGSNLGTIHLDTYLQIIRYDALNLEETMTREVVEPLKLFNFPRHAEIPLYFRIDTEAADVEGKLAGWEKAYHMGLKIKSQDVRDLIAASKPEDGDEVLEDPAIEQQKRLQQQFELQQQAAMQQMAMQGGAGGAGGAGMVDENGQPVAAEGAGVGMGGEEPAPADMAGGGEQQVAAAGTGEEQFAMADTAEGLEKYNEADGGERVKLSVYDAETTAPKPGPGWDEGAVKRDEGGRFTELPPALKKYGAGEPQEPLHKFEEKPLSIQLPGRAKPTILAPDMMSFLSGLDNADLRKHADKGDEFASAMLHHRAKQHFEELRQRRDAHTQEQLKRAEGARVVMLTSLKDPERKFVVHPSTREPGQHQLTWYHGDIPSGHTNAPSMHHAIRSAIGEWVDGMGPAYGDSSYRVTHVVGPDAKTRVVDPDVKPDTYARADGCLQRYAAGQPSGDTSPPPPPSTPLSGQATSLEPWEMTRDELADAVQAHDRPTLERARPLLKHLFPEYHDIGHDPWGIARAVVRGDELPRVPMVDFTRRHRNLVQQAIQAGKTVPPHVLAEHQKHYAAGRDEQLVEGSLDEEREHHLGPDLSAQIAHDHLRKNANYYEVLGRIFKEEPEDEEGEEGEVNKGPGRPTLPFDPSEIQKLRAEVERLSV